MFDTVGCYWRERVGRGPLLLRIVEPLSAAPSNLGTRLPDPSPQILSEGRKEGRNDSFLSLPRALEKRFQRLTSEHEAESRQRRKGEERVLELEQQMALLKVEQSESLRRCEDMQEAKTRVSECGGLTHGRPVKPRLG